MYIHIYYLLCIIAGVSENKFVRVDRVQDRGATALKTRMVWREIDHI